jgi:hypothetical protein
MDTGNELKQFAAVLHQFKEIKDMAFRMVQ